MVLIIWCKSIDSGVVNPVFIISLFIIKPKDPKDPEGRTMTYPDDMEFKTPHRSNANARMLLSRIGLDPDFENTGSTPIDDFIAATDKYLRMNVSDKDNPQYDEVEIYDIEAKRIKKAHPEVTHVGFN